MVKIRLQADTLEEIEQALQYFEIQFPDMRFTTPRQGQNPKYEGRQKYMSYGEPRTRNGKPVTVKFKVHGKSKLF